MRHLCDSNLLIAATVDSHLHHAEARRWLQSLKKTDTAALCRASQTSFLRLLTLKPVMGEDVLDNSRAIALAQSLLLNPGFEFIAGEPPDLEADWLRMAEADHPAPKTWMDAYLAAFAIGFSLRFVTFDRAFERFRKDGLDLLLLPPGT